MQAGVLDPESAKKIERYEASRNSFSIGSWILGLGIVAIGIGVIALVASNWNGISPGVKLTCDLLILLALAAGVLQTQGERSKLMQSELWIGLLFFFTLASMALVGQIYQMDAPLARTMLTWFVVTTPLLLLSKSSFIASMWALLAAAVYLLQIESFERLFSDWGVRDWVLAVFVWCGPLIFRLLGAHRWWVKQFPNHAVGLTRTSDLAAIVGATACTGVWYATPGSSLGWGDGLLAITVVLLATVVFRRNLWPTSSLMVMKLTLGFWGVAWLCLILGLGIERNDEAPIMAAVFQLIMLALMIGHAIQHGDIRRFRFWVGATCVRLLVVYFEIFGSLLGTGIGLVGGGALIVLFAWIWRGWASKLEESHASK